MTTRIQAFDFSVDLLKVLLWQYNDAANLQAIIQEKQDWYDTNQNEFWSNWMVDVFDLRTANDFGLSVWSIILNLPLSTNTGAPAPKRAFGFGHGRQNFNNGNFTANNAQFVNLSTKQKRIALQLRYFQLTTKGCVPEINRFFATLFAEESTACYVVDTLDMSEAFYVFHPSLSSQLRFIFQYYDLLPRPAGVGVGYTILDKPTFGFDQYHVNFDRGNFE